MEQRHGVGANFCFLLFFVFSLTCYRVFFSFAPVFCLLRSLCHVLYVNFVIIYYLALILLPVFFFLYGAISVTTFVEVSSLFGGPDHQPCPPQHLVSSFVFIAFSFISFCSRLKVVFLYCNYYFFALCRNLLSLWFENSKTFADRERVVFWNWPLPVHFCMELALARSHGFLLPYFLDLSK